MNASPAQYEALREAMVAYDRLAQTLFKEGGAALTLWTGSAFSGAPEVSLTFRPEIGVGLKREYPEGHDSMRPLELLDSTELVLSARVLKDLDVGLRAKSSTLSRDDLSALDRCVADVEKSVRATMSVGQKLGPDACGCGGSHVQGRACTSAKKRETLILLLELWERRNPFWKAPAR